MPYKDNAKQREAQRKSYQKRKTAAKKSVENRKERIKLWFLDLKTNYHCLKCGENHPACIEFHHRDPNSKKFGVGEAVRRGYSKETILKEIAKCDSLCSNCHSKHHWGYLWDGNQKTDSEQAS